MTLEQIGQELERLFAANQKALLLESDHAAYCRLQAARVEVHNIEIRKLLVARAHARAESPADPQPEPTSPAQPQTQPVPLAAGSAGSPLPAAPQPAPATATTPERRPPARPAADPAPAAPRRHTGGVENPAWVSQARQLPEPFTAVALGIALGIKGTGSNTLLKRWEDKGWVKRGPVRGEWSRLQAFGQKPTA